MHETVFVLLALVLIAAGVVIGSDVYRFFRIVLITMALLVGGNFLGSMMSVLV